MVMPLNDRENIQGEKVGLRDCDTEFHFEQAEFETGLIYSSRYVKQKIDCMDQELRRTIFRDFRLISIKMVFEALGVDETL